MEQLFEVVVDPEASPPRMRLAGELDLDGEEAFYAGLGQAADAGQDLVIDFSELTFFGSVGVRALVIAARRTRGKVILVGASTWHRQILELAGVHSLFSFGD